MTTVKMTPEMAKELLRNNPSNRSITRARVSAFAEMMKQGKWKYNGETIKISSAGHLIDGQHRCMACVAAGVPFITELIDGLDMDVGLTVDVGKPRTHSHALEMAGYKNCRKVASIALCVYHYVRGYKKSHTKRVSNQEILSFLDENQDILDAASFATKYRTAIGARESISGACHALFGRSSEDMRDLFFDCLVNGTQDATNATALLRSKVFKDAAAKTKMNKLEMFALFIKAWNAFCAGKKTGLLRYGFSGNEAMVETFPHIYGYPPYVVA